MNHDAITSRLEHHLRDAARTAPLRPGSELSVVRTAGRRSARRRQVTATASVVAVGGVGVLGLQQLTGTSGSEIRTGSVPGGAEAPAAPPPDRASASERAVEFVAPSLVWRVVRPDTAEAVGTTPWNRQGAEFPGVLLSTAPGRSPEHVPQLWRSDDGITFTPTGTLPADRSLSSMVGLGDRLYAFGTAPGVAASEANPLLASISSDGGNTWVEAVLPVDANRAVDLPGIVDTSTYVNSASITPDGVLLVVAHSAQVDLPELGIDMWMGQAREGIVVPSAECGSGDVVATTAVIGPGGVVWSTGGESGYECPTELRTWEQIGLPAETAAALREPRERLLFAVDDASFVEVPLPSDTAEQVYAPSGRHHVVVVVEPDGSRHLYRLAADSTWEALPDHPGGPGTVTDIDGRLVVVSQDVSESVGPSVVLVSTLGDDGTWTSVNVGGDGVLTRSALNVANGRPGILVSAISMTASDDATPTTTTTMVTAADSPRGTVPPAAGGMPAWELLHSVDGRTWSKESVADIAGVPAERISSITRIAGVDDHFIVTVTLNSTVDPDTDPDAVPEQLVLIGTLAG